MHIVTIWLVRQNMAFDCNQGNRSNHDNLEPPEGHGRAQKRFILCPILTKSEMCRQTSVQLPVVLDLLHARLKVRRAVTQQQIEQHVFIHLSLSHWCPLTAYTNLVAGQST